MGIITFFGVIVTLKLSSPIFKACLSKKGGMGVDMRSIGTQSWRSTMRERGSRAPHVVVLQKYNTTSSMSRAAAYSRWTQAQPLHLGQHIYLHLIHIIHTLISPIHINKCYKITRNRKGLL